MADDVELEELRMLRQLAMATAADTERTAAALSSGQKIGVVFAFIYIIFHLD